MHTDPIADMLTRIRNAQKVTKSEVVLPYSKIKFGILKLLEKEGWVKEVEVIKADVSSKTKLLSEGSSRFDCLKAGIIYVAGKKPKINSLKRISTPGRRVYADKNKLPQVLNGYGMAIISTSHGLMTNKEARQNHLGGEVICEIY